MRTHTELDMTFMGLRFRTMEMLPPGALMILNDANETCAIYREGKGWSVSDPDPAHWKQIVASCEFAEAVKRLNADNANSAVA